MPAVPAAVAIVSMLVLRNPMQFPSEMLDAHNEARARAGVPPLAWDARLADEADGYARELARTDDFRHSGAKGQGENLWRGTAAAFTYQQMVAGWSDEASDYRHGAFPKVSATGRWQDVAHYTQVVWRDTSRVGCGLATGRRFDVLVCRYSPPGNWTGRRAY